MHTLWIAPGDDEQPAWVAFQLDNRVCDQLSLLHGVDLAVAAGHDDAVLDIEHTHALDEHGHAMCV
jgi:hypothetical protein